MKAHFTKIFFLFAISPGFAQLGEFKPTPDSTLNNFGNFKATPDTSPVFIEEHYTDKRSWEEKLKAVTNLNSSGLEIVLLNPDTSKHEASLKISFHFSKKASAKIIQNFFSDSLKGKTSSEKKYANNLTFNLDKMVLNWDPVLRSFISSGKIPVRKINNTEINRNVPGLCKLDDLRSGNPKFSLFLELSDSNWYFFEYFKGTMRFVSSDTTINKVITSIPGRKKRISSKKDKGPYWYGLTNVMFKRNFCMKFYRRPD